MQMTTLYAATLVVFLALDAVGITYVIKPLFERHLGDMLADPLRLGPAAIFYAGYVAGVLWFVSIPALMADKPGQALVQGVILGAMCYATYEFTNLATLRAWSWQQVIVDTTWGAVLTGVAAWAGVSAARWVSAA